MLVTPTAEEGSVTVEARFGNDDAVQPKFVLPIVMPREYLLDVYYVCDPKGREPKSLSRIEEWIEYANVNFRQVGVSFRMNGHPQQIGDESYFVLPGGDVITNNLGKVLLSNQLSAKARQLALLAPTSMCFKVFCVGRLVRTKGIACASESVKSVFVASEGSRAVLAHELGHLFGLEDVYSTVKVEDRWVPLPDYNNHPKVTLFNDLERDWPWRDGRGFYSVEDYYGDLISKLLMCGVDDKENDLRDIPSGGIDGYDKYAESQEDTIEVDVGANTIERKERQQ